MIFVAGQSNSVGNSLTRDDPVAVNDAIGSLPIYYAQFGIDGAISSPGWDGTAGSALATPLSGPPVYQKLPATGAGGINDFVTCVLSTSHSLSYLSSLAFCVSY